MRDLYSRMSVAQLLPAAVYTADNVPVAVDTKGYAAATIVLMIGVGGITFTGVNRIDATLTHSDDDVTYVPVTDADMIGVTGIVTGFIKSLIVAHPTATPYRYGYLGTKRYLKLLMDFSGTHGTGTPLGAIAILGRASTRPTAAQA